MAAGGIPDYPFGKSQEASSEDHGEPQLRSSNSYVGVDSGRVPCEHLKKLPCYVGGHFLEEPRPIVGRHPIQDVLYFIR